MIILKNITDMLNVIRFEWCYSEADLEVWKTTA